SEKKGRGKVIYNSAVGKVYQNFGQHSIVVTDLPFDNNYFSYTGPLIALITTAGSSEKFAPPSLAAFLGREIILSSIWFCSNATDKDIDRISPYPSIGCLFDFCDDKADIRFGLVAGYISPKTQAELFRLRIDNRALEAA